ncbi:MAG: TonB-dependent receptor [Proteobacteria bacterium]|nr:TonB-dependent receptor [Pseudomonadota bacterium]
MKNITKMSLKSLLLVLSFLLINGLSAAAEVENKKTIDEMVVTGTRSKERLIDVPVTTEVITREKIEMSGAVDIGDLVGKYITGHYHKYNGLLSPVGLRGFRTESHGDDVKGYVLLLIDGHRIGTGNAAKINLDRIERVEVTKGPASALYGSAAMGGVINLITKKGEGDLSGKISGDYGSFSYYKGELAGGGEVNDNFRFYLSTSYEDIDDYDDPEFGTVYNTGLTKKIIGGNLVYMFNDSHELRLGGNYADLASESPSWENGTYSNYVRNNKKHNDKSHGYSDLEYNGDFFGGQVHIRSLGYYLWDRNHWNYGYPVAKDLQSKYTDTTWGTDHLFTWNMTTWNKLLLGCTFEWMEKESEAVSGGLPSTPYTPGMEYDTKALFLQDSLDLWNNRINLIAAVRYDRFDVKTTRPETGYLANFIGKEEDYDNISPKVGIGIKFFDELLRVRANVGEGFKSPSADQLSADYVHSTTGVHYVGNPDLDPETNLTYDVGFDIFHDLFTLKVGYFHSDYEDKIVQISSTINGSPVQTYANHGNAIMEGIDINVEWWVGQTFQFPFDMTLWSNITFNTNYEDKETDTDLTYISDYEVKSGLDLKYRNFSSQLNYVLVGPQVIQNWDNWPATEEGKSHFDFWDLTMRYKIKEHWEVRGSVFNLFDDRVEWTRGYPMAERNFRVGFSYKF